MLIAARLTEGNRDCIVCTKTGMAIRFKEDDARVMGRTARGVRAIMLDDGDEVVNVVTVPEETSSGESAAGGDAEAANVYSMLTVCQNGYGKRTLVTEYRLQSRGGKGVIDIKTEGRNGPVVGTCRVMDGEDVMIITTGGKVIRCPASGISLIGRNTMGVSLVGLAEGESVAAVARVAETESEAESPAEEQK